MNPISKEASVWLGIVVCAHVLNMLAYLTQGEKGEQGPPGNMGPPGLTVSADLFHLYVNSVNST